MCFMLLSPYVILQNSSPLLNSTCMDHDSRIWMYVQLYFGEVYITVSITTLLRVLNRICYVTYELYLYTYISLLWLIPHDRIRTTKLLFKIIHQTWIIRVSTWPRYLIYLALLSEVLNAVQTWEYVSFCVPK